MKKNLISILILALLVVNLILTAVMMFSTMSSVKKTNALVTSIASVLNIELEGDTETSTEDDGTVSIADTATHDIEDSLTISLKKGEDGKDHYCVVNVSLMMNTKSEDYATYGATIGDNDSLFKSIIIEVIGSYTIDEAQSDPEALRDAILARIQEAYGSTFIYKVAFSNIIFQ